MKSCCFFYHFFTDTGRRAISNQNHVCIVDVERLIADFFAFHDTVFFLQVRIEYLQLAFYGVERFYDAPFSSIGAGKRPIFCGEVFLLLF